MTSFLSIHEILAESKNSLYKARVEIWSIFLAEIGNIFNSLDKNFGSNEQIYEDRSRSDDRQNQITLIIDNNKEFAVNSIDSCADFLVYIANGALFFLEEESIRRKWLEIIHSKIFNHAGPQPYCIKEFDDISLDLDCCKFLDTTDLLTGCCDYSLSGIVRKVAIRERSSKLSYFTGHAKVEAKARITAGSERCRSITSVTKKCIVWINMEDFLPYLEPLKILLEYMSEYYNVIFLPFSMDVGSYLFDSQVNFARQLAKYMDFPLVMPSMLDLLNGSSLNQSVFISNLPKAGWIFSSVGISSVYTSHSMLSKSELLQNGYCQQLPLSLGSQYSPKSILAKIESRIEGAASQCSIAGLHSRKIASSLLSYFKKGHAFH